MPHHRTGWGAGADGAQRTSTVRPSPRIASTRRSARSTRSPGQITHRSTRPSTTAPSPMTDAPPESSRLARQVVGRGGAVDRPAGVVDRLDPPVGQRRCPHPLPQARWLRRQPRRQFPGQDRGHHDAARTERQRRRGEHPDRHSVPVRGEAGESGVMHGVRIDDQGAATGEPAAQRADRTGGAQGPLLLVGQVQRVAVVDAALDVRTDLLGMVVCVHRGPGDRRQQRVERMVEQHPITHRAERLRTRSRQRSEARAGTGRERDTRQGCCQTVSHVPTPVVQPERAPDPLRRAVPPVLRCVLGAAQRVHAGRDRPARPAVARGVRLRRLRDRQRAEARLPGGGVRCVPALPPASHLRRRAGGTARSATSASSCSQRASSPSSSSTR